MNDTRSRYTDYPDHPLRDVPQAVLDVARKSVGELVPYKEIDAEMVDPIADAVVAQLAEHGYLKLPVSTTQRLAAYAAMLVLVVLGAILGTSITVLVMR
jgi:hypothetical protein